MTNAVSDGWMCVSVSIPPMRLCLVAGVFHQDEPRDWWLVGKNDRFTRDPRKAVLFPFRSEWVDVARGTAEMMRKISCRGDRWETLTARVLVVGEDLEDPDDVVPAWLFERDAPKRVQYYFDKPE